MTPASTYRLQLHAGFDLDEAARVAPYLARLGVSHVYSSPLLASEPGSTHGYDVVDPTRVDPDRGGEAGLDRLVDRLRQLGLGLVVDIVPNHVAVLTASNPAWQDVLRAGPDSPFADHFDIAWQSGTGLPRMVVPVLGDDLDRVLDEMALAVEDGEHVVTYHDHRFPVRPGSLAEAGIDDPTSVSTDQLRDLLAIQHYDLRYWRSGVEELTYRRFFDVTSLGGIRVEDPDVAAWAFGRTLQMVRTDGVDGLRIDHPDGMRDPAGVLDWLRAAAPDSWIVVEKILEGDEPLRADWPVDGDVGYRFCNEVLGLFVDPASEATFTDLAARFAGQVEDHETLASQAKVEVVDQVLVAERRMLARLLVAVAEHAGMDVDEDDATRVLRAVLVAFGVYRTYVVPERDEVDDADRHAVADAVAGARPTLDDADHALLDLLGDVLVLAHRGPSADELAPRFQQVSGPVMAKGQEDTAFYRNRRFVALNEVGGDPGRFGVAPEAFHRSNAQRLANWARAMVTTSTHDTKRSEDVRARLAVLSEVPDLWADTVAGWSDDCAVLRGHHGPSDAMAYLAWQTVVGAWPLTADRLAAYLHKAAREEKRDTSWLDPDDAYEADLDAYARALVEHPPFRDRLERLLAVVRPAGRVVSLAQALLRLTVPGVPDTYQGCELWDLSLVDPDNRRPVDWDRRAALLDELEDRPDTGVLAASLHDPHDDGRSKLWVVRQALHLRRTHDLVTADYTPLQADGARDDHVVAFLRGQDVAVVVPRLTVRLGEVGEWDWADTTLPLPHGTWTDRVSGRSHEGGRTPLGDVLGSFPVALLVRDTERTP